jgi:uncharacterized DUF497 family protein
MRFEWDRRKATSNQRKHGVSFREAATVFADLLSWTFPDPDHSEVEDRFITICTSQLGNLLVIAHTEQAETIRIISARKATRRERWFYEEEQQ